MPHFHRTPTSWTIALALLTAACSAKPSNTQLPNNGSSGMGGFAGGQSGASAFGGSTAGNGTNGGAKAMAGGGAGMAGMAGAAGGGMPGGTGGMVAGTGGAGPTGPVGGAYLASGAWHGYAWTSAAGTGSTIMPKDFAARAVGAPFCVSGTVGASTDFSGLALLGVNLNQAQTGTNPPLMTVTPTGGGLNINVMNKGSSVLRVQIQGPMGATDATDRWCAPVAGSGGFIPWTSFNTKCWDASGTAYAKQPLQQVQVMVPGGMTAAIAYDFCLASIGEADGPGMMSGTGGSGGGPGNLLNGVNAGSGMITDMSGVAQVTRDGRSYVVQNNVWGANAAQTLSYNGPTFEIKAQSGSNGAGGQPVSYPSAFIGNNFGRGTSGSNLPKQVSAIQSVQTGFSHNADGAIPGQYNAAYDVWFSTNAGGDAQAPSGGYLMVWLYDPSGEQPIGTLVQAGATVAGMPGTWDVWQGTNSGKPCLSYVRTEHTTSMEFDLNLFIKDATTRPNAPIQSSWYLSNVFAGFEIWSGGVGLKCNAFYAIVN